MKSLFGQLKAAWERWALLRWAVGLAAGWFVLCKSSSGVTDAVGYLVGFWALWNWRKAFACWRNPVGVCFGLGVLWAVSSACWSVDPPGAWRDVVKSVSLVMGVWGLPFVLGGQGRSRMVLACAAGVVSVRLAADLVRLASMLGVGKALLAGARYKHPYLFTHPNVSCMMAGLSALALVALAAGGVRGGWRRTALAAGLAVDLLYLVVMASRGPQIVFAAALLAYPLLALPGWKVRLAALLAVAAAGAGLWLGAGRINPRLADATMDGFNGRDIVWRYVVKLVPEHPVRGFGYGKWTFKRVAYHDHSRRPLPYRPAYYPHAHSYWLMIAFQGGGVAVALWCGGWLALLAGLGRALHRAGKAAAGTPWRRQLAARAVPSFFLAAIGMILLYATGDYPDSLIRDVQFLLPALALAWAWPPRGAPGTPEPAP